MFARVDKETTALEAEIAVALSTWFWESRNHRLSHDEKEDRLRVAVTSAIAEHVKRHLRVRVVELHPHWDRDACRVRAQELYEQLAMVRIPQWSASLADGLQSEFWNPGELEADAGDMDPKIYIETRIRAVSREFAQEIDGIIGPLIEKSVKAPTALP